MKNLLITLLMCFSGATSAETPDILIQKVYELEKEFNFLPLHNNKPDIKFLKKYINEPEDSEYIRIIKLNNGRTLYAFMNNVGWSGANSQSHTILGISNGTVTVLSSPDDSMVGIPFNLTWDKEFSTYSMHYNHASYNIEIWHWTRVDDSAMLKGKIISIAATKALMQKHLVPNDIMNALDESGYFK